MPDDETADAARPPRFLIPPGYPQVINIDFNTLLNHGHVTPEVLEHLTGLLAALQDSFRGAQPRPRPASPPPDMPLFAPDAGGGNDCPELSLECPQVNAICPVDDTSACDTFCDGHVPICIVDDFTPTGCPPVCRDDFASCTSFDDLQPKDCPTKIEIFETDQPCTEKVVTE